MCCALLSVIACDANTEAGEHGTVILNEVIFHTGIIGIYDAEPVNNFRGSGDSFEASLASCSSVGRTDGRRFWHVVHRRFVYDFRLPRNLRVTIGSGPFYYQRGTDLGFDLEYYSFIEAAKSFKRGASVGLRLGDLSNAELGRRNPDTETFALVVSNPL
jgi:hypothetical protein